MPDLAICRNFIKLYPAAGDNPQIIAASRDGTAVALGSRRSTNKKVSSGTVTGERLRRKQTMRLKTWLLMGGLAGLVGGLLLEGVLHELPVFYLRMAQLTMIVFGAVVAAFVYEGARAVTGGREPSQSTDRPRLRWSQRLFSRAPRGPSGRQN
ncbi:MAG: hypothetical protein ABIV06_04885 [Thermoanaerobaculia bacterium]